MPDLILGKHARKVRFPPFVAVIGNLKNTDVHRLIEVPKLRQLHVLNWVVSCRSLLLAKEWFSLKLEFVFLDTVPTPIFCHHRLRSDPKHSEAQSMSVKEISVRVFLGKIATARQAIMGLWRS